MQPQSSEIDERAATVGRDVPNALQSQDDEQKLVDAFDEMTDAWLKVKPQGVTVTDAIAFTEAFRKVSRSRRNACIHRALNLIPDGNAMLLTGILLDKRMDREIVRTVFNDVLNREESVKKPILRRIFKDKDHPCWDDVAWILEATGELPKSE